MGFGIARDNCILVVYFGAVDQRHEFIACAITEALKMVIESLYLTYSRSGVNIECDSQMQDYNIENYNAT